MARRSNSVLLTVCALVCDGSAAIAQEDKTNAATDAASQNSAEVRFSDGSHLRMAIKEEYLDLATNHGKLRIAMANIRRIDLATRIPEATQRQIEQALVYLGDSQFRVREKASSDLLALREKAYTAVSKMSHSKDAEVSSRARQILEKLRAKVPEGRLRLREKDIVHTADSTISGLIELASFSATTQQFGPVTLKIADVESMYFLFRCSETELTLDGRYALNNDVWLDTGVDVTERVHLVIMASGEIDMYATQGYVGQYVGSPKGKKAWPGNNGLPHEPGTLLGKIGENGKVFVVRDQFDDFAPATGRLFLRAAGNPYNVTTTGTYTINIQGGVLAINGRKSD